MSNPILINSMAVPVVTYRGQRVITLAMIDQVHQRPIGTAKRNFTKNRHRFIEGRHFFMLEQRDEIRTVGLARQDGSTHQKIAVMTEAGYLLLVKSLNDDLSWKVQEELINVYFRRREEIKYAEWELAKAKGHIKRAEEYWFGRFPHWESIRRYYLDGYPFRVIAEWMNRSVDSCRRAVKSMEQKGLINPRHAAMNRLTVAQYQLWLESNSGKGW